ncbi:phage tail sheath protein FI [Mycetohabitans endofungorum]|uniref:Phage tail sheath protein FI n=2 Tax=Burkholderiaceae TaxID=119060 RepID=A0A2P5KAW9_9BURK|nr:phage tail sheath protein FI [Mycetohabitans endofungorum]
MSGVRLAETNSVTPQAPQVPSAVPVWIGWLEQEPKCNVQKIGQPVCLMTVDEWPWEKQGTLYQSVRHYFDNGGELCYLYVQDKPPTLDELRNSRTYESLLSETEITLVAIPQLGELTEKALTTASRVDESAQAYVDRWGALLDACQARPDWFFVLDAPRDMKRAQACLNLLRTTHALGARGQHAALYGPHLVTDYETQVDPTQPLVLPPSGAVVGMMVRMDRERGVWSAPANEALARVVRTECHESGAQQWFNPDAPSINLIRRFPGRGVRVWGCRTLAGTTAGPFRYVQVRRLVTYVQTSLTQLCQFAVFEPNEPMTWFKLKSVVGAWLHELWQLGGLAGAREEQAFEVHVGLGESMTAHDVITGQLRIKVRLAVLHAAEFVEIQLRLDQQTAIEQAA